MYNKFMQPMNFPHLPNATSYPINAANTPNVYSQYRNTFDYTNWGENTIIRLCNVPWDSVNNAMCFDSIEARDAWFDSTESYVLKLETPCRMMQNTIKIPLPFDMANLYNYVYVSFPLAPVADEDNTGVREWGFFIENINYRSPNATELTLSVDWWTTFIDRVSIKSLRLVQGHWAVKNSATVEEYLSNPLTHQKNLTDSENDVINSTIDVFNQNMWVNDGTLIAIMNIKCVNPQGDFTNTIPSLGRINILNGAPHGVMLACASNNLVSLINSLNVGFLANIQAIWIAKKEYFALSDSFKVNNVECWYVVNTQKFLDSNIKLTISDFNYPDSVKNYTKLYTGQYAHLTCYRSDGVSFTIPIDNVTSSAKLRSYVECGDTAMRVALYVNGLQTTHNDIFNLQGMNKNIYFQGINADHISFFDIPTYALYMDSDSRQDYFNQYSRAQARLNASTAKTNADAAADTAKTNADASADTAKNNTTRSTNNNVTNTKESVTTSTNNQTLSNELSEDTTNLAITVANENNWENIESQINKLGIQGVTRANAETALGRIHGDVPVGSAVENALTNATLDNDYTNRQQAILREAQADGLATTGLSNMVSAASGISASLNGLGTNVMDVATAPKSQMNEAGGKLGGQALSFGMSIASAAVNVASTVNNFNITLAKEDAMQDASRIYQIGDGVAIGDGGKIGNQMNNLLYQNLQERKLARAIQTNSNNNTSVILNGGSLYNQTVRHGSLATATSINANNGNLQNTIAANNKTTTDANATATQTTTKNNATRSQTTSKANNQRIYDNTISSIENGIKTDNIQPNIQIASANNVNWANIPAGVQCCVSTPNTGDVLRIGERFQRYGYMCSRTISAPALNVMDKFTYWRCSEVWCLPNGAAPQQAVNYITNTLKNGVTVWNNPNQIGDIEQ